MNYFTSKGLQYHFSINELDGKSRMKFLEISRVMMCNKKLIEKWYENVVNELKKVELDDEQTMTKLDRIRQELM
jgi:uncharacterized protein (DUF488 family)